MSAILPEPAQLSLFITASIMMGLTPGPDMLLVLNRSIGIGFSAALVTLAGIMTGALFHTVAAAFGLSLLLLELPVLYEIIRYAGAGYLVYLAWQLAFREGGSMSIQIEEIVEKRGGTLFRQALLTNLLNPKVSLFILSFLPQFVPADADNAPARIAFLGLIFFSAGIFIMLGLAALADFIRTYLIARPGLLRFQAKATGALFVLFAVLLVFKDAAQAGFSQ